MHLRRDVERFDGGLVITLAGELDAYHAPALRETFGELLDDTRPETVVLDLTAVTFLDSTALGAIVGALKRVRQAGGELRVVLPETPARRIFEVTSLDRALDVRDSREDAITQT